MLNGLWEIPNNRVNNINHINQELNDYFNEKLDIGESFSITDLYSLDMNQLLSLEGS